MPKITLLLFCGAFFSLSCTATSHAAQLIGGDSIGTDSSLTDFQGGFLASVINTGDIAQPAVEIAQNGSSLLDSMRVIVHGTEATSTGDLFFDQFIYKLAVFTKADYLAGLPPGFTADLSQPVGVTLVQPDEDHRVPDTVFGEASFDPGSFSQPSYDFRFDLSSAVLQGTSSPAFVTPLAAGDYILGFFSTHILEHGGLYVSGSVSTEGLVPYLHWNDQGQNQHPRGVLLGQTDPFFLRWGWNVFETPALPGDYNGNGIIDAADYTAWRDAVTAGVTELLNDPTPGTVDESDFDYWRAHFGETLGSGAGSVGTIPEPSTALLPCIGALGVVALRRRYGNR